MTQIYFVAAASKENVLLASSSFEVVVIVTRCIILQLINAKRNSLCLDSPTLGVSMDMVEIIGTPCVDHLEGGTSFNVDRCMNCLSGIQLETYPCVERLRDA